LRLRSARSVRWPTSHHIITRCSLVCSDMEKEQEDSRGTEGGGTEVDDGCGWSAAAVSVHTVLDNSGLRWGQQAATAAARCNNKPMCCLSREGRKERNRRRKSSWPAGPKKVGHAKSLDWKGEIKWVAELISFSIVVFLVSVLVNDFIQHLGRALSHLSFICLYPLGGNFIH
jgi:hypothetical protein